MSSQKVFAVFLTAFGLFGCGGGSSPPPSVSPLAPTTTTTITNPLAYLVESVKPDGNPATPLHATDPLTYRRQDFGGYQDSDSFLAADGSVITTWSYAPFGPFVQSRGDGGEQYVVSGDTVYITQTLDGSVTLPVQFGQRWPLFRTDADASWRSLVASGSGAYTRYTIRQAVPFPAIGPLDDTIVSEHYNAATAETSQHMERFFLVRGWGRLVWQSWGRSAGFDAGLATRCPDFGWNALPGWVLQDCRESLTIVPADGSLTGLQEWNP